MKRLIFSLSLVFGIVTASYAAIPVPKDSNNFSVNDPKWAGASTFDVGAATGTNDALIATGKGILFGVFSTSGTNIPADFLTFRDTATANHTSGILAVTASTIFPGMSVQFTNGLCVTNNISAGATEHYVVVYRLQSNQN